jgi:hypothetical protein
MPLTRSNEGLGNKNKKGIVYLLHMDVDGKRVVKIGVTSRAKIEERVCEILTSYFKSYREFSYCRPKRFGKTTDIYEKEALLHKYFEDRSYESEKKFDGCSEYFDISIEEAVDVYEMVVKEEIKDVKKIKQRMADRTDAAGRGAGSEGSGDVGSDGNGRVPGVVVSGETVAGSEEEEGSSEEPDKEP